VFLVGSLISVLFRLGCVTLSHQNFHSNVSQAEVWFELLKRATRPITGPPIGPVLFFWLASVNVVYNAAGGRSGWPPGAWMVGAPAAWRVGGQATDTARRASTVTSR